MTEADIENAILRPYGADFNELTLTINDDQSEAFFCVGGGPDLFVVFIAHGDDSFDEAIDPGASSDDVELVAGSQTCMFPRSALVPVESALQAARYYLDTAEADRSVTWRSR